jgi:hypothetical protein
MRKQPGWWNISAVRLLHHLQKAPLFGLHGERVLRPLSSLVRRSKRQL